MTESVKKLIDSSNKQDYILGMELHCKRKGLKYFQDLIHPYIKGEKYHITPSIELTPKVNNIIIKLPEGIAIVTFSGGDTYIGRWEDYNDMHQGDYNSFYVHEIMDI